METIILEKIANGFSSELVKESKSLINDLTDEIYQLLNKNVQKYLQNQIKLNKNVKNILYGSNPTNIYDFYFPVDIKPAITLTWHTDTSSVTKVFNRTNFLTIIGDAGCGKTTLTKYLILDCLEKKYAIPVLIELRNLNNDNKGFIEYIREKLLFFNVVENNAILDRFLENGKFVFFIDGYDELARNNKYSITRDLIKFVQKNSNNKFLLTSRPYSDAESIPMFQNYYVKKLTPEQVDKFISLQLKNENELCARILNSVKEARAKNLGEFLSNPLLLSLYILTFQYNSDIPNKKHVFYRRVIQTLFSEHDSISKYGYIRQRQTNLSQEQLEEILMKFSFVSYFKNQFNFDLDYINPIFKVIKENSHDLNFKYDELISDFKSLSLWVEDTGIISFNHRSIQEYFTALYIKDLEIDEKRKIYDKIKGDFRSDLVVEVEHLLSLCEELDEIEYLKYFYIPLVSAFSESFIIDSEKDVILNVFPTFCKYIHKNPKRNPILSHPLFKLPNIAFSEELCLIKEIIKDEIESIWKKKILESYWKEVNITVHNEFQRNYAITKIDLTAEFPDILLDYLLKNKEMVKNLKSFAQKLKISQHTLLEYINSKKENNKEIFNMIK